MAACPQCSADNPPHAKFCLECGAGLPGTEEPAEVRKTVTLVFCDLTGSTALGEKMDPESLRRVMSRYFDDMSTALQRHGGTIEKFIGDAVMAVFGIPVLHEDDALRGVRAAADMQEAMRRINAELERDFGVGLQARIGVNTGEVIAGDHAQGQAFATGDTVNVAARLEQAAPSGEILLGEETYRLVRDWVEASPVEPLELKGKSEPMPAFRLERVLDTPAVGRQLDTPFVGRDAELEQLQQAFDRAVADRTCHLVTIFGTAGVGKSRITTELIEELQDRSRILIGHCLPYGDGITFWPLAEAVRDAAELADDESQESARAKIEGLLGGSEESDIIAARLQEALGLREQTSEAQEMFWAVRRFFETLAADRPLIVVFDDVHWAEPTFLDLIEYLVGWSKEQPLLLVCLARNELLESRPGWGSGMSNSATVTLEPLDTLAAARLIVLLLGGAEVPHEVSRRIVEAAEGNPLFVSEMLRMMVDDGMLVKGESGWQVAGDVHEVPMPGTIQALVASRIDRLDQEERQVIGRGSVIGRVFWWSAISRLTPENHRSSLAGHLQTLVRRELVAPERSTFPGEDAFRFSSVLISDAAYQGLSKKLRADLHESFIEWLERKAGDRLTELEEIFGYHLERSYLYRRELGVSDAATRATGLRAADLLASAGRRALARADMPAAANLLARAAGVEQRDAEKVDLLLDLFAAALETQDLNEAKKVLDEADELARAVGDRRLQARVSIQQYVVMYSEGEEGWREKALAGVDAAVATFKESGDDLGLTQAYQLLADIQWAESKYGRVEKILEEALTHAQRAGSLREESKILSWLPNVAMWGPTNTGRALELCGVVMKLAGGNRMVEAKVLLSMAGLHAMRGDFEQARELVGRSKLMFEELGLGFTRAAATQVSGMIEMLADDPVGAEKEFREGYEALERMGDRNFLPSVAAFVADALYAQERYTEAEKYVGESRSMFADDDETAKADWGPVQAKLWARAGKADDAIKLAAEAVEVLAPTDELSDLADSLMDLAEVLKLTGHPEQGAEAARRALDLYERKGVVCAAQKARSVLAELAG